MKREELRQKGMKVKANLPKFAGKLSYAANVNLRRIIALVEDYEKSMATPARVQEWQQKRVEKLQEMSGGKMVVRNGVEHYDVDPEKAFAVVSELQKEYAEDLEAWAAAKEEIAAIGDEEVSMKWLFVTLTEEQIEKLDGEAIEAVFDFLVVE